MQSRLAVLTTLSTFLRIALAPEQADSSSQSSTAHTQLPPWYLSTSFATPRDYAAFLSALSPSSSAPHIPVASTSTAPADYSDVGYRILSHPFALASAYDSELSLGSLGLVPPPPPPYTPTVTGAAPAQPTLLGLLHPTLLSSFLDAAPSAFSPTTLLSASAQGESADLNTIVAVVGVARELYWRELGGGAGDKENELESGVGKEKEKDSARKLLVAMLSHAAAYFPFGGDDLRERSAEAEAQLLSLSLTFSSLVSLLILSSPSPSRRLARKTGKTTKTKQRKMDEMESKIETLVQNVREWVVAALRGEVSPFIFAYSDSLILRSQITTSHQPLGLALTPSAYSALEPTIWSLLNQAPASAEDKSANEEVWNAVLDHFAKAGSGGEVKARAFAMIERAVLVSRCAVAR